MENLPSLLESIYATWLSLSSTMDTMDVIFAIVCGLGLYLLLLPFIDSHLSLPLPNIKFTRKPQRQMTWQSRYRKKFQTHSRKDSKAWRESLKKLKEKEKDESFLEEISPGYHLNSLGNMFKSPNTKQDSTILPPFWNLKEKSEEQTATQKLSYPTILGDHFQEKYNQLFWGLPSLHSESLVATAWISQATSTLPCPFFFFNVTSSAYRVQMRDKMSPVHSCTRPLSYLDLQSPPLTLSPSQFQAPAPNQVHPQSPLPALLPSSLPYTIDYGDYGPSCSQSQSQSQCLPTEIQHAEGHLLTKLESRLPLPLMVQRPQEVYDVLAPNLSQDWDRDSILPDNFPISCELREKLEQHIQKWLIQHRWDLSRKIQESLEGMQLQNTVTEPCQTRDKPGPSLPSVSMGDHSKDCHKVRFPLERESGKNLGPILGKISRDPNRYLEKAQVTLQGANLLKSERNPVKSLKRDSRTDSTEQMNNNLESTLKAHMRKKSEQINQGVIPLCVRQSWLAMNDGFSMSDIQMETKNLLPSKSLEKSMSSSQKLAFLDPGAHQALEEHIVRFRVKHRWGLPFKMLKPVNVIKLKKAESLPVALCDLLPSTTSVSGTSSAVEVVRFLGNPCQLREVVIEDSSPSLGSLLLVSSPSCKDIERTLRAFPSGADHEPSQALPTKAESNHHFETLKHNFTGIPSQSGTVLEKERETQEVLLLPRRTSVQNPGAHSHQETTLSEFPQSVETEPVSQPQVYTTAMLLPEHPRSTRLPADTLASQGLGDIVVVGGDKSLVQQKPSTPKHQVSPKSQINVLAPTYRGEETKRHYQSLPKPTQVPPESPFKKLVSRFLRWIHPKKAIKGQESPPKKGKPTGATAQSQQKPAKKKPRVDSNVAEAQELTKTLGQMLEKKMTQQHKLCALKFNQHRKTSPPRAPQSSYGHKPASYSEQRREPSHPGNSSCQRYSTKERRIKDQKYQNIQLSNKPQTPQNPNLLPLNTTLNLLCSSQHGTIVPTVASCHLCCPRHCAVQRNICRQLENSSLIFNRA
ncbi:spermatogenesis-associated protein 31-like [Arvicola amphibius]|uniref:spermatogenesis-associated protein 31-like n=1 Tax=Arvicola amphibius TaxID=1047088 RepID=UPI0018E2EF72|nr:spermatogenesis-associated protein 31-like [Arvicola amphibius]